MTGVAEAIKVHFKRNPLAIVNVKGRAKGTSVQEVVLKLEVCLMKSFYVFAAIIIEFAFGTLCLLKSFPVLSAICFNLDHTLTRLF